MDKVEYLNCVYCSGLADIAHLSDMFTRDLSLALEIGEFTRIASEEPASWGEYVEAFHRGCFECENGDLINKSYDVTPRTPTIKLSTLLM